MSVRFVPVSWTPAKWAYDIVLVGAIGLYLLAFFTWGSSAQPTAIDEQTLAIRAYGTCAFILLTLVLTIGPLARLDRRFLPLLYNRRHAGVLTCLVALGHAQAVLDWYFAFSDTPAAQAALFADSGFVPFSIAALL